MDIQKQLPYNVKGISVCPQRGTAERKKIAGEVKNVKTFIEMVQIEFYGNMLKIKDNIRAKYSLFFAAIDTYMCLFTNITLYTILKTDV